MKSLTITLTIGLLLTATSSYGGVVKRSVESKPFKSAKDLLKMKGASDAIKRSFDKAGTELEDLAEKLEKEVDNIAQLSAYINTTQTEQMSEALAEAMNIQSLMNDQRTELSGLAKQTVSKCDRITRKLKETVEGKRGLNSGMRSMLRDMRSLLLFSERKLKEAKDIITILREKVNKIMVTLRVFQGLVKVAGERQERIENGLKLNDTQTIMDGLLKDIKNGVDGYPQEGDTAAKTTNVITSLVSGITRLTTGIMKAVNRPNVAPMLATALEKVNEAIAIVTKQKDAMEREVELIIIWKDAVDIVKNDVFQGDLKGGTEEDQELFDEIAGIIEDGDVGEIYEAFNGLSRAASSYLSHVKRVCPSCATK
jgi:uncharacterized protein YoxC